MNNTEFVKIDNIIYPKSQGSDYELENGKIYNLSYNGYTGVSMLELTENTLNMPNKVYESKKDKLFKNRVLTYYKNANTQTTGVMLAGTKGTGKTLLAKKIAIESGLPIIIIDDKYPASKLEKYFSNYKNTEICILFDEIEKKWNTEDMLGFLDGVQNTARKLILMTCNDIGLVSSYMQDRCSRVRYLRKYNEDENIELIPEILKDKGLENNTELSLFIKRHIQLLSIDNIIGFINEYILFKDNIETLDELIETLNISTCNRNIESDDDEIKIEENKETKENTDSVDDLLVKLSKYYGNIPAFKLKDCLNQEVQYYC